MLPYRAHPAGTLAFMPEAGDDAEHQSAGGVSAFGMASAVLAVIALAAAALIGVMWSSHHRAASERNYQARVMQAAAQWTAILINMDADNVEPSMIRLRDGTVGELNTGFEGSIAPFGDIVKTLRSRTDGQVESVSIEVAHHELARQPGQRPPAPATLPPELASRTDTVLVIATSNSENAANKPTTVHWNLRLGVSDVDGTFKISRLESLR